MSCRNPIFCLASTQTLPPLFFINKGWMFFPDGYFSFGYFEVTFSLQELNTGRSTVKRDVEGRGIVIYRIVYYRQLSANIRIIRQNWY